MTDFFDLAGTVYRNLPAATLREWGRTISVPTGTVGLAVPENATAAEDARPVAAGEKIKTAEVSTLHLFRSGPIAVPVTLTEGSARTKDGFSAATDLTVTVSLDPHDADARHDFVAFITAQTPAGMPLPGEVTTDDLGEWLREPTAIGVRRYLDGVPAEKGADADHGGDIDGYVRSSLRKTLLNAGLLFDGVPTARVAIPEWERLNQEAADARKQEVVASKKQRMRELWEKDRRKEALSAHEFDEFMKALQHEGVLQDIQRQEQELAAKQGYDDAYVEYQRQQHDLQKTLDKLELDRQISMDRIKFEERLAQAKRAYDTLKGASLEFFISTIEDEQERAKLYKHLIQKGMTPEQLAAAAPDDAAIEDVLDRVLARIEKMLDEKRHVSGRLIRPNGIADETTSHRIMVVCGKQVLAYDPRDYRTVQRPNEVYDVSHLDLGSLRSVRVDGWEGEPYVLAGARQGVYAIPANNPGEIREYAFFTDRVHKGGTNSATVVGDYLFAAHSEQGLAYWPMSDPSHLSMALFDRMTKGEETTRALTVADDIVYFASGGTIAAFDPSLNLNETAPSLWQHGGREITSIVALPDAIYAGNRAGQLLRWARTAGDAAPEVVAQETNAIYMLKLAWISGMPHLVIGSKAFGATVRSLNDLSLATHYQCDEQVRWVDAASDYVVAVSADQHRLFIWNANDPSTPIRMIETREKIQDMHLWIS